MEKRIKGEKKRKREKGIKDKILKVKLKV